MSEGYTEMEKTTEKGLMQELINKKSKRRSCGSRSLDNYG